MTYYVLSGTLSLYTRLLLLVAYRSLLVIWFTSLIKTAKDAMKH